MSQPGDKSNRIRLCICRNDTEKTNCKIDNYLKRVEEHEEEYFSTVADLQDKFGKEAKVIFSNDKTDPLPWTWNKEECDLYYIFVYDEQGKRIREQELIAPSDETISSSNFPEDTQRHMVLRVCLFQTDPDHGFVIKSKANGNEFDLVIDLLSEVKQAKRSKRRCPIYFGFLSPSYSNLHKRKRVALKRELIKSGDRNNHEKIIKEIDLAQQAGGQYSMKYLAQSAIEKIEGEGSEIWIAMDLCCMDTFNDLIEKKDDKTGLYLLDGNKMKICFRHILLGLHHLHRENIFHGEMIMENILVSLDRRGLKIGDYDHVKQIEGNTLKEASKEKDLEMTASMFFMCLTRNINTNSKQDPVDITEEAKQWISSLLTDVDRRLRTITEVIFPNVKLDSISKCVKNKQTECPFTWVTLLKKLSEKLRPHLSKDSPDAYMSAYLIMHMALDKPEANDVLTHPFFWDEFEMLSFVCRADAFFHNQTNYNLENLGSRVKQEFRRNVEHFWPDLQWLTELRQKLNENPDKDSKKTRQNIIAAAEKVASDHGGPSEITGFLRVIRNSHSHYHEPQENNRYFKTSLDVWQCFNAMYPGLICLLHRALWENKEGLPDDVGQFFTKQDYNLDLSGIIDR